MTFQSIGDVAANIVNGIASERPYAGGKITEPGVYSGLDIEKYHHDPDLFDGFSISSSGLRTLLRRPSEYWWTSPYNPNRHEPESKSSLDFGKAAHMLLLGEEGFAEQYVMQPETCLDAKGNSVAWSLRTNSAKEWMQQQADAGRKVITETEIEHIRNIAASLSAKEAVRLGILSGRIERSIVTRIGNIWVKTRPDVLPNSSGDFVDLKTAASVDNDSLSKAVFNHGYFVQAGLTRMVVREVLGPDAFTSFTFVFVEKGPPYDVRIMQLKDEDIDLGERMARRGLDILADCIKQNRWPGYDGMSDDISWIEMPAWGRTRIETELSMEAA